MPIDMINVIGNHVLIFMIIKLPKPKRLDMSNQTLCDFTNMMAMSMTKRTNAQSFPAVIIIIAPEPCFQSLEVLERCATVGLYTERGL